MTGATGYIGTRLVPELLNRGHQVRAAYGHTDPPPLSWADRVAWTPLDVTAPDSVAAAVTDVDAVFYLVHGLGRNDFRRADLLAAQTTAQACADADVQRIVYLSGIVPDVPADELSEHLSSRLEVEQALSAGTVPSLTLRAAVILGAGSTSFEVIRQMSEHLPVQPIPTWMCSQVQPIAVSDVVRLLGDAVEGDHTGHVDIGGPERCTYPELLRLYAAVSGLRRVQVTVPMLPESAVARLSGLLTRVPAPVVEALVGSLRHDMVATPGEIDRIAAQPRPLVGISEAIRRSLRDPDVSPDGAETDADPLAASVADPPWAGGFVGLDRWGVAVHRPTHWWSRLTLGVREAGSREELS
ncbi:Uncharacterized conserved protein YbjT, contains NAD(P)-binding and DUF2867 domains [Austwickia chelonae]|nr:Uncharacterized conserved protein YbjT, contains NAD(P)-binding and DUF2867 domains [Austwickia chelonae]